jgi:hypothetical protein
MSLFDVNIEIQDGEHEYIQHHYTFCKDIKEAKDSVVRNLNLNNERYFVKEYGIDGCVIGWTEASPGYRVYKIGSINEARITALGLSASINLTELMRRPILPLDTKSAEWIWSRGDCFEYWWSMGEYYVFLSITPGDSERVYIGAFNSGGLTNQIENMKDTWHLDKEPKNK